MNPYQLASLTILTSLLMASPLLSQVSEAAQFRISQESAAGLKDYDNNLLGYFDAFSTSKTLQEFYGYNSSVTNSFGGGVTLKSGASNLFLVQASDGLGLFSVNSYNNTKKGLVKMQFQVIGDVASLLVKDDLTGLSSSVNQPQKGQVKTSVSAKHSLLAGELTDGFALGTLENDWVAYGEILKGFSGIDSWAVLSPNSSPLSFNIAPKLKIRLDLVEDGPVQAVPEPLTVLGAGVAVGFWIFFKRKLNQGKQKIINH